MNTIRRRLRAAAFTLAEVVVALGLFGITAAAASQALLRMNNNAALSRLQTGASTVAQNQIDLVLSISPFNPQKTPPQIPAELTIGTTTTGSAAAPTIPVYTDPKVGGMQVLGWMTTEVANTGTSLSGTDLNLYRITVTVSYRFKGRTYSVTMGTMRTSDV